MRMVPSEKKKIRGNLGYRGSTYKEYTRDNYHHHHYLKYQYHYQPEKCFTN